MTPRKQQQQPSSIQRHTEMLDAKLAAIILTDDERRILHAASIIQAERAERPIPPLKPNPERQERWRAIADAFALGVPVVYRPPDMGTSWKQRMQETKGSVD